MSAPGSGGDELLTARDVLRRRWERGGRPAEVFESAVLCHQAGPLGHALSRLRAKRVRGFLADVRILRGKRVAAVSRFGVGAPAAVAILEELIASGVTSVVSVGVAGGLREDAAAGELIVVDRAICDEGTSGHYDATMGVVQASEGLTARVTRALTARGCAHVTGAICSTDAPYRTTRERVRGWSAAGGVAVDMEAAGLIAAARYRGIELAVACCVADHLSPRGWHIDFDQAAVDSGIRALFQGAVEALEE